MNGTRFSSCDCPPGMGGIDACIAPLIQALNDGGIPTVASCCGHGHRPGRISLKDGRELFIIPDFATAQLLDAAFPVDINGSTQSLKGRG